jgi:hypothetical protein
MLGRSLGFLQRCSLALKLFQVPRRKRAAIQGNVRGVSRHPHGQRQLGRVAHGPPVEKGAERSIYTKLKDFVPTPSTVTVQVAA